MGKYYNRELESRIGFQIKSRAQGQILGFDLKSDIKLEIGSESGLRFEIEVGSWIGVRVGLDSKPRLMATNHNKGGGKDQLVFFGQN